MNSKTSYYTRAFFALLIITSVQNILAMIAAKYSSTISVAIFGIKEAYIFLVISLLMLTIIATGKLKIELIFPFGIILYLFAISLFASPYFNFMSLRQALVLPVFLLFGFYFAEKADIRKITKWVFYLYLLIVSLGLFERFFLYTEGEAFFRALGVSEWLKVKGWGEYELPRSWYSRDLLAWTEKGYGPYQGIRRIAGILIGDAVNFGQAMAFPLVYSVLTGQYLIASLFFLAIIVGMSKGGFLGALGALFLYITFEHFSRRTKYLIWFITVLLISALIYTTYDYIQDIGSVVKHFRGGYRNIVNIINDPFGGGVGSGGNFGIRFNRLGTSDAFGLSTSRLADVSPLGIGESYVGTMVAQFGIIGLVGYFYYAVRLLRTRLTKESKFLNAVKYTALMLFIIGLVSETAFTYIGTGFVVALIPFVLKADKKNKNDDRDTRG